MSTDSLHSNGHFMNDVLTAQYSWWENDYRSCFTPEFNTLLQHSLAIIEEGLDKYPLNKLAFSFNGGKDSIIILHLLQYALAKRNKSLSDIVVFHFAIADEFDEMNTFMTATAKRLGFNTVVIASDKTFKEKLWELVRCFSVEAVFIGTRRQDPHGGALTYFSPTDKGWPPMVRINPILDWCYSDVWLFLRNLHLPYCSLYDAGYTSLGGRCDTSKNPALLKDDGQYLPAYMLAVDDKERDGRAASAPKTPPTPPTTTVSTVSTLATNSNNSGSNTEDSNSSTTPSCKLLANTTN